MNSWLYLTAQGFLPGDKTEVNGAPVCFWQDDLTMRRTSLNDAAVALKGHRVHLILPMEMCSWLLTEPWPGRRRPTAQSLAFAVEDQLADDLEDVHIAVGPADDQRRYPLLIIHTLRFKEILARLHERGLNIVSVQADADLLPRDQVYGAWWDGRWIIGGALEARLSLSVQGLEAVQAQLPADMVWLKSETSAPLNSLFNPGKPQAIDLLQGAFKPASRRLPWRGLGAALLLMFSLTLGLIHTRSGFLEAEAARLYALSEQRFKTLYPQHTRIVDVSAQLKALQQQGAAPQNGHMVRLLKLTEQVIGASSVDVQRMELRAGVGWTLNITARSFAELEQLRERGVQSALPITLGNARQQGNRVEALLTLKDGL